MTTTPKKAIEPNLPPIPKNRFLESIKKTPVSTPAVTIKPTDGDISTLDIPTKAPQ